MSMKKPTRGRKPVEEPMVPVSHHLRQDQVTDLDRFVGGNTKRADLIRDAVDLLIPRLISGKATDSPQ